MNSIVSIPIAALFTLIAGVSHAQNTTDAPIVYLCASCNTTQAEEFVKWHVREARQCQAGSNNNNNRALRATKESCDMLGRNNVVLNEADNNLIGFRFSANWQQLSRYTLEPEIISLIPEGYQFSQGLSDDLAEIVSGISQDFATPTAHYDWLKKPAPAAVSAAQCKLDSHYQAALSAISGEFRNEVQRRLNSALDADLLSSTPSTIDAYDSDANSFSVRRDDSVVYYDNLRLGLVNTLAFNYASNGQSAADNRAESTVAYEVMLQGNSLKVLLSATKTHFAGNYWSVLANPRLAPTAIPACSEQAFDEVFSYQMDSKRCIKHYNNRAGEPLISVAKACSS